MHAATPEFWIDVGGTFTDCFLRLPDGTLRRNKVLSSGITKGTAGTGSSRQAIVDPGRSRDPADFWAGYELRLLDAQGAIVAKAAVASCDASRGLILENPLSEGPLADQAYELTAGEEAPILAIRQLLALRLHEAIPPVTVRLGTTRGTNALITRRGAKCAFVTTRGFGDVLRIGYQNRPKLFELDIQKPEPLFAASVEIDERLAADGQMLAAPDANRVREQLAELRRQGIHSLAVCLLHAFEHPAHEKLVGQIVREVGFREISLSHEVAPLIKIVARGDTTVMDAYLNPVLRAYVNQLRSALGGGGSRTDFQSVRDGFNAYLRNQGKRLSEPRQFILDEVLRHATRFGADELYEQLVRSPASKLSRPTLFRTLAELEDSGVLIKDQERGWYQRAVRTDHQSVLRIMTSAGGLVAAERFVGKDSILSGPAGGVVGYARVAEAAGFRRAIGFDMGGTSTDVSRYDGRFELEYETEKAGVRVVAPMMAVETVAAGGGSICHFDGVKLVVGPDSAGADPGPACYGRGGPLAVTDLNFYLGKILPERFPFPLHRAAVEARLAALRDEIEQATGKRYEFVELCDGFLRVANANMVKPIRSISVAKGYDPREYVLVAFGGAAGQHGCAVAADLGMRQVLLHADAGLLSAYGIGLADVVRHGVQGIYQPYSETAVAALSAIFEQLDSAARVEVLAEGIEPERIEVRRSLDLRYQGLDAYLTISEPQDEAAQHVAARHVAASLRDANASLGETRPREGSFAARYEEEHQRLYGYTQRDRPLEIVAARVEVTGRTPDVIEPSRPVHSRQPQADRLTTAYFGAQPHETKVYLRERLQPGDTIAGPAIVGEASSTTVIDPGWQAEMLPRGELLLTQCGPLAPRAAVARGASSPHSEPDPVLLEIFNNQFAGIAEQMGITLRNTASSVNVKERLDFSFAVFTAEGDLVVNAPHIPVHLGAMSETVKQIVADNPQIRPGDVFVTNDPYRGGSHLPDITVVTPVHESSRHAPRDEALHAERDVCSPRLLFFTASRAHHAEIGGIRPGSMPPFSKNLAEEGVLIRNFNLVDAGQSRLDELRALLGSGPYPSRAVRDNLADITAQVAANNQGARDLGRLVERHTLPVVTAYMRHIQTAAETKMRRALRSYVEQRSRTSNVQQAGATAPPSAMRCSFTDHLDDGSPIAVAITIEGDSATIDFTGTGPVLAGNLNANRAIVTAAVMYCLRVLIDEDIPLNQGVLAPIKIVLPECLLNPPTRERPEDCPAVVGGNVETSQRVVDVLLGALGLAAASQGTMNNTLFGDASFGYYETICGGAGATPQRDGADAVHTHMTNTRLTDPEVIEKRYPVRVHEFSIRRGSGGAGQHRGGDGIVRRLEFLRDLEVSLLHSRRGQYPPYGLAGGSPGDIGHNALQHADGRVEPLSGQVQFLARAGDVLSIETPGGGGYGTR